MIELSTYYKDKEFEGMTDGRAVNKYLLTATVCVSADAVPSRETTEYFIQYKKDGECFFTEEFPGHSLYYVEDAAENWALGVKSDPFPAK